MSFPFKPGPPATHRPPAADVEPAAVTGGPVTGGPVTGTGHPAVDEVLRSLENTARLPLPEQIAEYEAAHQVLRETLAGIDG